MRGFLFAVFGLLGCGNAVAQQSAATGWDYRLRTLPEQVYFVESNSKERLSGSIFFVLLEQSREAPAPTPKTMDLTFRKGTNVVRTEHLSSASLIAMDFPELPPARFYSANDAERVAWPHAYRLAIGISSAIQADALEIQVTFDSEGNELTRTFVVPIRAYRQKTQLVFPFRGPGIISAGGALEGGHRNRSGLYAIDALGLTGTYGPLLNARKDEVPGDYAGWGREVIAPAAGRIVVAKNDHVDQPKAGKSDPAYFLPQYRSGGDPGNLVIIDHGNGEFSMLGHMQRDSVRVKPGDFVTQGQVLGLIGNSGDTSGPHLHYQLQSGPDWERSDALPFSFSNVTSISRGSYFEAK